MEEDVSSTGHNMSIANRSSRVAALVLTQLTTSVMVRPGPQGSLLLLASRSDAPDNNPSKAGQFHADSCTTMKPESQHYWSSDL